MSDAGIRPTTHTGGDPRGQTTLDLVAGLTLFLVTVTVVLGQLPSFLAPYQEQATPTVADRAADELVGELVTTGEASEPPVAFSEPCTVAFFGGIDADECRFDTADTVRDRLGISSRYGVNVSLVHQIEGGGDLEHLCRDGGEIVDCGDASSPAPLVAGPPVPANEESISVTYRGGRVTDGWAVVVVRVWHR